MIQNYLNLKSKIEERIQHILRIVEPLHKNNRAFPPYDESGFVIDENELVIAWEDFYSSGTDYYSFSLSLDYFQIDSEEEGTHYFSMSDEEIFATEKEKLDKLAAEKLAKELAEKQKKLESNEKHERSLYERLSQKYRNLDL